MRKVGLYTEWGICMGCNACQIACKDAHDLPLGVNLLKVRCRETRENGQITVRFQPEACRQCRNAPCARACLAGALFFSGGRHRRVPAGALQRLRKMRERLPLRTDLPRAAAAWNLPLRRLL